MISEVIPEVVVTPDWAVGYEMSVPCLWQGCDREVEWFGNQHECRRGHCCNYHLREYLSDIMDDLSDHGHLVCVSCQGVFHMLPHYFTAVRA